MCSLGSEPHVIAWGSYDETKPRVRMLLSELRARDMLRAEINIPVWKSVRDKAVAGRTMMLKQLLRLLASYPGALVKLIRQPPRSSVLLPYPAIPDIFMAWPIARVRRHAIVFDAFISLHDTIVSDRGFVRPAGVVSKLIWIIEKLALRMADIILVDTDQHGDFYANEFGIARSRLQTVLVGAEPAFWSARNRAQPLPPHIVLPSGRPIVLFYGQLIPLHGLETIFEAIERTAGEQFHWLLVGSGQEQPALRRFLEKHGGENVSWIPWVEYEDLPALISASSIGLGIFGTSDKAARVIPNKVFQILAAGRPVITRASPAVDAIADRYRGALVTVPEGDGAALACAVRDLVQESHRTKPVREADAAELGPGPGISALAARLLAARLR